MFVRVLGSSPESSMIDVKGVMSQYGEVLEVRKGKLSRKLPNVTNGTWTVRMILDEGKVLPSFVFVNDDGEIWQLAHDNQETVCWQCGGLNHIGSRCKQKAVSIAHDLLPVVPVDQVGVDAVPVQTWAHVVRGVAVPVNTEKDAAQKIADVATQKKREDDEAAQRRLADDAAQKEKVDVEAKRVADEAAQRRLADETAQKEKVDAEAKRVADEAAKRLPDVPDADILGAVVTEPVEVAPAVETLQKAANENIIDDTALEDTVGMDKNTTVVLNEQLDDESAIKIAVSDDMLASPSDISPNPAKVGRFEDGSETPGSNIALPGSPSLRVHKDPRVGSSKLPAFTSFANSMDVKLGEAVSQSTEFESLSDAGSSNANRPASAGSLSLEQNNS